MKPVAIFRHVSIEGPGFLAAYLDERRIPWQLIAIDKGDAVPERAINYSGLVFMGGPMSVNDDLPWIAQTEMLIQDAVEQDIPVLGHCLGGQLMSKALGAKVLSNPVKEIGWGEVKVDHHEFARAWFGPALKFTAFHWHGETFDLPSGATHLLSSAYCQNQAWALGKHLALQCHVEMTSAMIRDWCDAGVAEVAAGKISPAVQTVEEMLQHAPEMLPQLSDVASCLYGNWLNGLVR